jgi:hypothetical protein
MAPTRSWPMALLCAPAALTRRSRMAVTAGDSGDGLEGARATPGVLDMKRGSGLIRPEFEGGVVRLGECGAVSARAIRLARCEHHRSAPVTGGGRRGLAQGRLGDGARREVVAAAKGKGARAAEGQLRQ